MYCKRTESEARESFKKLLTKKGTALCHWETYLCVIKVEEMQTLIN